MGLDDARAEGKPWLLIYDEEDPGGSWHHVVPKDEEHLHDLSQPSCSCNCEIFWDERRTEHSHFTAADYPCDCSTCNGMWPPG